MTNYVSQFAFASFHRVDRGERMKRAVILVPRSTWRCDCGWGKHHTNPVSIPHAQRSEASGKRRSLFIRTPLQTPDTRHRQGSVQPRATHSVGPYLYGTHSLKPKTTQTNHARTNNLRATTTIEATNISKHEALVKLAPTGIKSFC